MARADANIIFRCRKCKTDTSELIRAVPIDSKVYEVACPKCEQVTTVQRTPEDPVEEE